MTQKAILLACVAIVLAACSPATEPVDQLGASQQSKANVLTEISIVAERGVAIPGEGGRIGGSVQVQREGLWENHLWEFGSLLIPRNAEVALVGDDLVVHTELHNAYYVMDYATGGSFAQIDAAHPTVQAAFAQGGWCPSSIEVPIIANGDTGQDIELNPTGE